MMMRFLIFAFIFSQFTFSLIAQEAENPKSYICFRTVDEVSVDGIIEEESWKEALWTDDFTDIEGDIKPAPKFRTRAKMLWDDEYFYVAAEMEEPNVWGTLAERDAVIFHDNDFEVFIDPDGDTHLYYEFEMNALNTVWDLLLVKPYRDGGPAVNGWDIAGLKSGVNIRGTINDPGDKDTGWTLEIAFPWKILKECAGKDTPPHDGDIWRINFSRVEWRTETADGKYKKSVDPVSKKTYPEDNWVWSPQGLVNMHYPEMWGFVRFSDKSAGSSAETFIYPLEEKSKQVLRRIYYAEKKYYEKNGAFTDDLSNLDLNDISSGIIHGPVIRRTMNSFEAFVRTPDGNKLWHISGDGKTWKEQIEPDHPKPDGE